VPKRATLKALTRAVTFNLGSIAFGSLIVTILELLRLILNAVSQYEGSQGDSESASDQGGGTGLTISDWTDLRLLRELPRLNLVLWSRRDGLMDRLHAASVSSPVWLSGSTNVSPLAVMIINLADSQTHSRSPEQLNDHVILKLILSLSSIEICESASACDSKQRL
jgi:hypothetical protein